MELIHRNMLEVVDYDELGRVSTCKMHDIMRDLALCVAKEEKFGSANEYGELIQVDKNVRRLSLCGWNVNAAPKVKFPCLRTLVAQGIISFSPDMISSIITTGNWLFADCNFLCQLFFFDTRQRGPFANWNFLQSAKQDLPTAWLCRLPGSWQRIAVGKGRPWLTPSTPSPLPTATPSAVGKGAGFANCHPPWQSAKNFYFFLFSIPVFCVALIQ